MVALINHGTTVPRENQTPTRTCRLRRARPGPGLRQARTSLRAEPEAGRLFPKAKQEPKPGRLAREKKYLGAETDAGPTAAAEVEAAERVPEPRSGERSVYDGDTTFKLYLRETGRVKPLTRQEEIELAAQIKRGNKRAREQMIKANLRLVVKIARDFEGIGLSLLDLVSEGNIGLIKAVERFDPAKDGKLSTCGAWWIKQSIKRALASQSKMVPLPIHAVDSRH